MKHLRHLVHALAAVLFASITASAQQAPIIIKATTLLDGKGGTLTNVGIVIQGSKIIRIEKDPKTFTYDLSGMTVMPGWIETHAHISSHFDPKTGRAQAGPDETPQQSLLFTIANLNKMLMTGFTTVQSPAGSVADKDVRDLINEGRLPGPRLLTSLGAIRADPDKPGSPTPDEIRFMVRKFVADGADLIKLHATKSIREGGAQTLSFEQIQAACSEANAFGKRSLVHVQGPEGTHAAVLAGCTTMEHGNRITDETLDLMVERGVFFDSNNHLLIHNYLDNKVHYFGIGNWNEEGYMWMEKGLAPGNDTFKRAMAKKVKIVFGTDATAGAIGRNYEEMVYRVKEGGQPPMDAIVGATSLAAESLWMDKFIGSIAPGMEADIVATEGNPAVDITAVRNVTFVMKGGRVYKNVAPSSKTMKTN